MLFQYFESSIVQKKNCVKERANQVIRCSVFFYTLLLANVVLFVMAFVGVLVGFNVSSVKKKKNTQMH